MGVYLTAKHYDKEFDMGYGSFQRLRSKIADYVPSSPLPGTVSFLEQPDYDGKLTYKQCKDLYADIQLMPDDGALYGYQYCAKTITDFKEMLECCIKHRTVLKWM